MTLVDYLCAILERLYSTSVTSPLIMSEREVAHSLFLLGGSIIRRSQTLDLIHVLEYMLNSNQVIPDNRRSANQARFSYVERHEGDLVFTKLSESPVLIALKPTAVRRPSQFIIVDCDQQAAWSGCAEFLWVPIDQAKEMCPTYRSQDRAYKEICAARSTYPNDPYIGQAIIKRLFSLDPPAKWPVSVKANALASLCLPLINDARSKGGYPYTTISFEQSQSVGFKGENLPAPSSNKALRVERDFCRQVGWTRRSHLAVYPYWDEATSSKRYMVVEANPSNPIPVKELESYCVFAEGSKFYTDSWCCAKWLFK